MRRDGFQSLAFRLADPASFDEAKLVLEADKRVTVDVYRESAFYAKQSELLSRILQFLAVMITGQIAADGETNWLEGAQLLAVYVILAVVFYFLPEVGQALSPAQ